MISHDFYGDLRIEVLYQEKDGDGSPRIHFYKGQGMSPQFILPNLEAAKRLRRSLDVIIEQEEGSS